MADHAGRGGTGGGGGGGPPGSGGLGGSAGDDSLSGEITTQGLNRHTPTDNLDIDTALKFDEESGLANGHVVVVQPADSLSIDVESSWTDSTMSRPG